MLIHNNTIENNFRGITYFLNCTAVGGGGSVNYDLADNSAYNNTITVGTQTDAFATVFSWTLCDPSWLPAYMDPANKKLKFFGNTYDVPNVGGRYWFWNALKFWNEWLAIPQDAGSTVQ